jgi:glucose-1-phosphate cytidylyltransferase
LKRAAKYLDNETFCMTYGDGLSDVDITKELAFHRRHGKLATVLAVQPPGRFGVLKLDSDACVSSFEEKPSDEIGWINGGFFVLEPSAIDYVADDTTSWERAPLMNLARDGQLAAFAHTGFWQPCDTLRDKRDLETLWSNGNAPWRAWT